jgi:hypothetical protein
MLILFRYSGIIYIESEKEVLNMYFDNCIAKVRKDKNSILKEIGNDFANMDYDRYNCGGFALGLTIWYKPYNYDLADKVDDIRDDYCEGYIDYLECCETLSDIYVNYMTKEPDCREILKENELRDDEYLVAFKASWDDFHYARKIGENWYHKMGSSKVQRISEEEVYSNEWWAGMPCNYCGDLRLLAIKKPNFKQDRLERKIGNSLRRDV